MRKTVVAILMIGYSTFSLAYMNIPVIVLTEGWRSTPIVVNDSSNYFYAQEACTPQLLVKPKVICGEKQAPIDLSEQDEPISLAP